MNEDLMNFNSNLTRSLKPISEGHGKFGMIVPIEVINNNMNSMLNSRSIGLGANFKSLEGEFKFIKNSFSSIENTPVNGFEFGNLSSHSFKFTNEFENLKINSSNFEFKIK